MKLSVYLLSSLCVICGCNNPSISPGALESKIKSVESNLIAPVFIEGDSTWTIEERMAHYGVPGVSIAVIKDFKIEWLKAYGVMDRDTKEPVTTTTLFQAGSISKPVSAYAALKLVEQNKISLDSNINDYLKSWKLPDNDFTKNKKVTLKHLLSHSAGTTVHGFLGYSPDLPVPSLAQVLDGTPPANSAPVRVDKIPGESFRYSGGGTSIVQLAMTDVEGKSFPNIMRDLILTPLRMTNSTYNQPLDDTMLSGAATGYLPDGAMTKGKRHTYPEMAAAGLWTTAEDLAKFAIDILDTYRGKSKVALSQSMVQTMLTPYNSEFAGLGVFIEKKKAATYFGHNGWDEGFCALMKAHRDNGYGVVIMINSNHPDFMEELMRSVALSYSWDDMVPIHKPKAMNPQFFQQISGRYRNGQEQRLAIWSLGNKIFKKSLGGDPVELINLSDSMYISRHDTRPLQFKYSQSGQLELLVIDPDNGKVESTFTRMKHDEMLPFEYLEDQKSELAITAYQSLLKTNPKEPAILEDNINNRGYQLINSNKLTLARDLFKINTLLYPKSANVYDSYAEALMKNNELDLAKINYKKSLALNPKNDNATKMLKMMADGK